MSEEQEPYELEPKRALPRDTEHAMLRHETMARAGEEPDVRWPPVHVTIVGPGPGSGAIALGDLLCHILVESSRTVGPNKTVTVTGIMDDSAVEFTEQLRAKEEKIELLERALQTAERKAHEAILEVVKEQKVAAALESRLGTVTGQKLALAVAHGDVPAEQFEARRKIEVDAVRNLVAALRVDRTS